MKRSDAHNLARKLNPPIGEAKPGCYAVFEEEGDYHVQDLRTGKIVDHKAGAQKLKTFIISVDETLAQVIDEAIRTMAVKPKIESVAVGCGSAEYEIQATSKAQAGKILKGMIARITNRYEIMTEAEYNVEEGK